MSSSKKLVVNLSENLYDEFNRALKEDNKKRDEFIQNAIILYIEEKKKSNKIKLLEMMRNGYSEMAKLNLELAEMGIEYESEQLKEYETRISESDIVDDSDTEKRRYILC